MADRHPGFGRMPLLPMGVEEVYMGECLSMLNGARKNIIINARNML